MLPAVSRRLNVDGLLLALHCESRIIAYPSPVTLFIARLYARAGRR